MPKSEKEDSELTDYQYFSRYAILNGLLMSQSAALWNEEIKDKYENRNDLLNLLDRSLKRYIEHSNTQKEEIPLVEKNIIEGEEYLVELKKRRRDRELVKIRLVKDGYRCKFCGFSATELVNIQIDTKVLDVHHIYPLQDGERETKIEDLLTLCPNCHKLIHAIGKKIGTSTLSIDLLEKYIIRKKNNL